VSTKPAYGPVRITIPAQIAYNIDALNKGIGAIMDKLGCGNCFSGADCTFIHERDFVINEVSRVEPEPAPWTPAELSAHRVSVLLSKEVAYDMKAVQTVIAKLGERGGCAPCHSGIDFSFRQEIDQVSRASSKLMGDMLKSHGGFAVISGPSQFHG